MGMERGKSRGMERGKSRGMAGEELIHVSS